MTRKRSTHIRKWRIERAGNPLGGYFRLWIAMDENGVGHTRATWAEALAVATTEIARDWALMHGLAFHEWDVYSGTEATA